MRLYEWEHKSFVDGHKVTDDFVPGFIDYLTFVWANRNRYQERIGELSEEERQERRIHKQRFFDFTIDGKISARNYVGIVQYEGVRIEVLPKIFRGRKNEEGGNWGIQLLYWLSYCRKFKFPFSLSELATVEFEDFLEMLISIFANHTEEVLSSQPYQAYQELEEESAYLKGQLLFDAYTNNNLVTGNWHRFTVSHKPLQYDNGFNRIIKYVSSRLSTLTRSVHNRAKLESILFLMHDVTDVSCSASDCEKVMLNPLYKEYIQVLGLCNMFLSNQFIDIQASGSDNFCFLVPMEYVFEDFTFGFLQRHWPELKIKSQSSSYLATRNGQDVFKISNDIILDKQLIVDTKYKLRPIHSDNKAGVSQADMYQMVSYAIKRNCQVVLLLYPWADDCDTEEANFQIQTNMLNRTIDISVRTVDITFNDLKSADGVLLERFEKAMPILARV